MGGCFGKPGTPTQPGGKSRADYDESPFIGDPSPPPAEHRNGETGTQGGNVELPPIEVEQLSQDEVSSAAGGFDKRNFIGYGPAGGVFRGTLIGQPVAVRKIVSLAQAEEDFMRDVELMGRPRHRNVVQLLAYCVHGNRSLVLEFAHLGNLAELLRGKKDGPPPKTPLTWQQRLKILQGAAQGLAYLHSQVVDGNVRVVHQRVTSGNVLVFEGYEGKISECKMRSQDQDSLAPNSMIGEFVYSPPEAMHGETTQKGDVYSFGIVLLEALSGHKTKLEAPVANSNRTRLQSIKEWALGLFKDQKYRDALDPTIPSEAVRDKALERYCRLASACLEPAFKRPDMLQVAHILSSKFEG